MTEEHEHTPPYYRTDCVACVVNLVLDHRAASRIRLVGIYKYLERVKSKEFMDQVVAEIKKHDEECAV